MSSVTYSDDGKPVVAYEYVCNTSEIDEIDFKMRKYLIKSRFNGLVKNFDKYKNQDDDTILSTVESFLNITESKNVDNYKLNLILEAIEASLGLRPERWGKFRNDDLYFYYITQC